MIVKIVALVVFILVLFVAYPVKADCYYNGRLYPVGTEIGGYVCTSDGTWQKSN